jgi:hypothetical protein
MIHGPFEPFGREQTPFEVPPPTAHKLPLNKGMHGARQRSLREEWRSLCTQKYSKYYSAVSSEKCINI